MKENSVSNLVTHIDDILSIEGDSSEIIEALGFSHATTKLKLCTFAETQSHADSVPSNCNVLVTKPGIITKTNCTIVTNKPRDVFYRMHEAFKIPPKKETVISKNSNISKYAIISDVNVVINDNVIIESGVIIKENVIIGNDVTIRSGSVIGGAGFQMHKYTDGVRSYVKHRGKVVILDNVEIQQNTCIDRAIFPWDATVIGHNTKIGSLVQVAHGCKFGSDNLIASGSNFGGRVNVGSNNWFGLNAVISNGIEIGDNCRINLGAVVTKNIENDSVMSGNFAIEHDKFIEDLKRKIK